MAREAIGEKLLEAGRIQSLDEMTRLLPHGVSHYVGLDCHDVGDRGLLEPGMIVTMEPGAYMPHLGFGIRIEDDALITEDGRRAPLPQHPQDRRRDRGLYGPPQPLMAPAPLRG